MNYCCIRSTVASSMKPGEVLWISLDGVCHSNFKAPTPYPFWRFILAEKKYYKVYSCLPAYMQVSLVRNLYAQMCSNDKNYVSKLKRWFVTNNTIKMNVCFQFPIELVKTLLTQKKFISSSNQKKKKKKFLLKGNISDRPFQISLLSKPPDLFSYSESIHYPL